MTRSSGPDAPEKPATNPKRNSLRGGYSSRAMLGTWVICGLVSLALLIVGIAWQPWTAARWLLVFVLMALPWLYYLAVLCYRRLSVRYLLTTQRFIHERGVLRRVNDRIEVLDMDDITFEQNLWERLTGVGTIRIASHDHNDPELFLPGIENVRRWRCCSTMHGWPSAGGAGCASSKYECRRVRETHQLECRSDHPCCRRPTWAVVPAARPERL